MQFIIDFFAQIAEFFTDIISFIQQQIQSLGSFLKILFGVIKALPVFTRFYGTFIGGWFIGILALAIMFRILGREG